MKFEILCLKKIFLRKNVVVDPEKHFDLSTTYFQDDGKSEAFKTRGNEMKGVSAFYIYVYIFFSPFHFP